MRTLSLLTLLFTLPAQADVFIVDSRGYGDFTEIQPAVDAAEEGDTILVRPWLAGEPGYYQGFVVEGRKLQVAGVALDRSHTPVEGLVVRNTGADQTVVISNFQLLRGVSATGTGRGIELLDNQGPVRLNRIGQRLGQYDMGNFWDQSACSIRSCWDVVFVDCLLHMDGWPTTPALTVEDSRVAVYASLLTCRTGCPPDEGLDATGSWMWMDGSTVWGGNGITDCTCCADGADGANLRENTTAFARETVFEGGDPGWEGPGLGCMPCGGYGAGYVVSPDSTLEISSERSRRLQAPAVAHEGSEFPILVSGNPGEAVMLFRGAKTGFVHRPGEQGIDHLRSGQLIAGFDLGVIPPSGVLEVGFDLDILAMKSHSFFLQARTVGSQGEVRLSHPAAVVVYGEGLSDCPDRIYVDDDAQPGGDGRSWETALDDLEVALDLARVWTDGMCPEREALAIFVAEGTYRPSTSPGPYMDPQFHVPPGVVLFGGFAGWETSPRQRVKGAHPSVLSADLNGDDQPEGAGLSDNSDRVIECEGVLDGFEVVAATGSGWDTAVLLRSATMRNCRVHGNGATGVHALASLVVDCVIEANTRGAYLLEGSRATHCTIRGNMASGGVRLRDSELIDCEIVGNLSSWSDYPAGVRVHTSSGQWARISGCTIHGNRWDPSQRGAGIYVDGSSDGGLRVENTILWMNQAAGQVDEEDQLYAEPDDVLRVEYCCIMGLATITGPGNHGQDPLFVDPLGPDGIAGTADDDLRLGFGSPCADAGSNLLVPPDYGDVDRDGNPNEITPLDLGHLRRFRDDPDVTDTGVGPPPIVDMGAHERQGH